MIGNSKSGNDDPNAMLQGLLDSAFGDIPHDDERRVVARALHDLIAGDAGNGLLPSVEAETQMLRYLTGRINTLVAEANGVGPGGAAADLRNRALVNKIFGEVIARVGPNTEELVPALAELREAAAKIGLGAGDDGQDHHCDNCQNLKNCVIYEGDANDGGDGSDDGDGGDDDGDNRHEAKLVDTVINTLVNRPGVMSVAVAVDTSSATSGGVYPKDRVFFFGAWEVVKAVGLTSPELVRVGSSKFGVEVSDIVADIVGDANYLVVCTSSILEFPLVLWRGPLPVMVGSLLANKGGGA
jgi:hypothetical protein